MRSFLHALLGIFITMSAAAQHEPKGITASNGEYIGFYQFLPPDYSKDSKTHPLIIFLHGAGEKGDGTSQLKNACWNGVPREIDEGSNMTFTWNGKTESFIVLTPQLNSKYGWWQNWYVDELITYATKNLRIDPNRIILTGLSMGGGGTWQYAGASLDNAKRLAAIGISCGACTNTTWANMVNANLPIWAFHAENDGSPAPASCTKGAISSINALNPTVKPYFTLWPDGDHWIWGRVYNTKYEYQNPNIYEWFLAQNKSLAPNIRPVANAGNNQSITTGTATVTLNAGGSTDRDGKLLRFIWSKVSGPSFGTINTPVSENGVTTVTNLTQEGTYVYEVKVVDDRADWTTAQVTITVSNGPSTGNQNPIARAGNDITITAPASSVTLNGSTSSDPDGSIAAWNWSRVSGATTSSIATPNTSSTVVNNLTPGTYVFRLKVTDNKGATAEDDITVTVNKSGEKPTAWIVNAGADATITLPTNSAKLDGSASSDPAGVLQKFEWVKISGPAQFSITNAAAQTTTVTNLAEGLYGFKLTVWNNAWSPASDTVYITVKGGSVPPPNQPVIPKAGTDVTITLPTSSTTLDGSASVNPTGNVIKAYKWRKINGPASCTFANAEAAITAVSNLTAGTYSFELMVWNHNWEPRADTVLVTVKTATTNPGGDVVVANAGADISLILPSNSTTLNGSASADPTGVIKEYKWRKIAGPAAFTIVNAAAPITSLAGLTEGIYQFELMVWGHNWVPRADTVQVTVKSTTGGGTSGGTGGTVVVANAGPDIAITLPANSASLNGSASRDPLGIIKEYKWKKISGPAQFSITNPSAAITPLTNLVEGVYSFELMVWGNNWVPRADTVLVVVSSVAKTALQTTNATQAAQVSVNEVKPATTDKIRIYPNPAVSMVNVETSSSKGGNAVMKIYDASGSLLRKISYYQQASLQTQQLAVSNLKPGVYQIEISIENKPGLVSRFIKQ